eukprot:CAMPEP_0170750246 /NCGR_PEP_ID=MMETSP0437-20130122/10825_1 /TAXON_ID=0 /ORGANISM="Sexangularia sp." /LENGTH=133 /DNA_ID=CAMNT_0011089221 /DNA_START=438 /DNA_END=839 /DNA_ORIENTATION=+
MRSATSVLKALILRYGIYAAIVYYTVNMLTILGLFIMFEFGIGGVSGESFIAYLTEHNIDSYIPGLSLDTISPLAGSLTLAWLANHFFGPVQVAVTVWATPAAAGILARVPIIRRCQAWFVAKAGRWLGPKPR